jgi:mannose-6-phosphate isomerase
MKQSSLYPMRFEPICQYRIWGGRRLAGLLSTPLPGDGPIGEAWLLSDRDDHPSVVADGPLKGQTIKQLLAQYPEQMLGKLIGRFPRFPLLLKFLDTRVTLSVQVHPSDEQTDYIPAGESGKTEAWVVLEAAHDARIYAGLKPGITAKSLRAALADGSAPECLASFSPQVGDGVLLPAGTVHSLGGLVVFEVQENSDVTFRLYDWDHVDPQTHQPRPLQVEQAMACIDWKQGAITATTPVVEETEPARRERLFGCEQFRLWRISGESPFTVGAEQIPRVLVCVGGQGKLESVGADFAIRRGDTLLLPAAVGTCLFRPDGAAVLLEIALPEGSSPQ